MTPIEDPLSAATRPLRLAIACPALSGHLNPALALGRELRDRGHAVAYIGIRDAEHHVRTAGLEFLPIGASDLPAGAMAQRMTVQGGLAGRAASRWILKCLLDESLAQIRDMPRALADWGANAVLADQVTQGAATAAEILRLPYLTLCNALPIQLDLSVPPFPTTLGPLGGRLGRLRNLASWLTFAPLVAPTMRALNRVRVHSGLSPYTPWRPPESRLAILSQLPRAFEFPGRTTPPHFHPTGPWTRPATRPPIDFPWDQLDGRPLIYASLGTLQNRMTQVFQTIAAACADLPFQLVLSLGRAQDDLPSSGFAGNPLVVRAAPQLELLQRASLVITHAGLNTVLETLASGIPMVAIPIANDQPGVAARIRHSGAGDFIPLRHLTVPRLTGLIRRVLSQPQYGAAARSLQRTLAQLDGLRLAAGIVETTLHHVAWSRPTHSCPVRSSLLTREDPRDENLHLQCRPIPESPPASRPQSKA